MKKWLLIMAVVTCSSVMGQDKIPITASDYDNSEVAMADGLRSEGKIYILTGIILIVLIGTIIYLVTIDRRVARLEKEK